MAAGCPKGVGPPIMANEAFCLPGPALLDFGRKSARSVDDNMRECKVDGLCRLNSRIVDKFALEWIERWIDNSRHRSQQTSLIPLGDNAGDWQKLREIEYA